MSVLLHKLYEFVVANTLLGYSHEIIKQLVSTIILLF